MLTISSPNSSPSVIIGSDKWLAHQNRRRNLNCSMTICHIIDNTIEDWPGVVCTITQGRNKVFEIEGLRLTNVNVDGECLQIHSTAILGSTLTWRRQKEIYFWDDSAKSRSRWRNAMLHGYILLSSDTVPLVKKILHFGLSLVLWSCLNSVVKHLWLTRPCPFIWTIWPVVT